MNGKNLLNKDNNSNYIFGAHLPATLVEKLETETHPFTGSHLKCFTDVIVYEMHIHVQLKNVAVKLFVNIHTFYFTVSDKSFNFLYI